MNGADHAKTDSAPNCGVKYGNFAAYPKSPDFAKKSGEVTGWTLNK